MQPFFALSANRITSDGSAGPQHLSLTWLSVRASGCPLRWPEDVPLFLRPCAFFEVGTREAHLSSLSSGSAQSALWSSLGASARIEALVGDVLAFSLDDGFSFPLTRDSFGEYHTPPNGVTGRLGISYRFK